MNEKDFWLWSARILGIVVSLSLGLFALDAFAPGKSWPSAAVDAAIHLIPAAIVLTIVMLAWRRPWIGGTAFVLLALGYAFSVRFRIDWTLVIAGPLLTVGLLFLWSARRHA